MDLTRRWPQLGELADAAEVLGGLELWAFGSMLTTDEPHDLDVAVIYEDRLKVVGLRTRKPWELMDPPIHLIGLTQDEDSDLGFLRGVGAVRLRD